jgi:hypothetical protein
MFGVGIVEMTVLVLIFVAAAVAVATALLAASRRLVGLDVEVARARRRQGAVAALSGVAALVAIPAGLVFSGQYGARVVLPILPSLMVVAACAVLWVGEVTFTRPSGAVRSTVLNARTITNVVPRGWVRICVGLAVLDLAIFLVAVVAGRWFAITQAAALSGAAVLAWLVCRSTTTRPTIATDLHADAVLRRTSGGRVLRWLSWGLAATAAGDLIVGGLDLQSSYAGLVHALGVAATILGWVLVLAAVVLPFAPVPQLPHTYPAPCGDTASSEVR